MGLLNPQQTNVHSAGNSVVHFICKRVAVQHFDACTGVCAYMWVCLAASSFGINDNVG